MAEAHNWRANDRDDSGISSYGHTPNRAVIESGRAVAGRIEHAVANQSGAEYQAVMQEVNAFRDNHTGSSGARQYTDFLNAATAKLQKDGQLHAVELFAADQNFADMDKSGTGRVDRDKAETYKGQNYLDTHFSRAGEHLADPDGKGISKEKMTSALHSEMEQRDADWLFAKRKDGTRPFYDSLKDKTPEHIQNSLETDTSLAPQARRAGEWAAEHLKQSGGTLNELEDAHKNLKHLFEKGADGRSLYDKMEKDGEGNIANANILKDPNLSTQDRDTLKWLSHNRTWQGMLAPFTDYMKADTLHDLAQKAGVIEPTRGMDNTPRANLETFFQRNNSDGRSLYNRLKDEHGHVPAGAIDAMLQHNSDLTDRQRRALEFMKSQAASPWSHPLDSVFGIGKDFEFAQLREMAEKEGLLLH